MALQHVAILGNGNVAWQLAHHLQATKLQCSIITRSAVAPNWVHDFGAQHIGLSQLNDFACDMLLLAISDNAIAELNQLPLAPSTVVAHTSGSMPLALLDTYPERGVVYPLQTLSLGRALPINQIPFFTESSSPKAEMMIRALMSALGANFQTLKSNERVKLHVAAVMVNNFTNHLLQLANQYAQEQAVAPDALKALSFETIQKFWAMGGLSAQTGPAKRGDDAVIEKHLAMLTDNQLKNIYQLLSQSIKNTHAQS